MCISFQSNLRNIFLDELLCFNSILDWKKNVQGNLNHDWSKSLVNCDGSIPLQQCKKSSLDLSICTYLSLLIFA